MMERKFCPREIVECETGQLPEILGNKGKKTLLIGDREVYEKYRKTFEKSLKKTAKISAGFQGECCEETIGKSTSLAKAHKVDFILAFGGGKAIDTAKSVSEKTGIPLAALPASAATCAAFTSHSVIYSQSGKFLYEEKHEKSPETLILAKEFLISQPKRLLASGMSDAAAKYYEFTFSNEPENDAIFVEFSKEILTEIYTRGKRTYKKFESEDVYRISRINIIHTGIISAFGGKEFRSSLAHAIANGLTQIIPRKPELRNVLHGELVGIGMCCGLFLLGRTDELLFLRRFLEETGVFEAFRKTGKIPENDLAEAAEFAIESESGFSRLKFTAEDIVYSLKSLKL
ncbi:MAG: iron-containing alcohol dehydrogenase [Elusimicrobia bacterium]|nr:iron-containing alcohol dehydrogenase [Elusimicrobiota bacterium]